MQSRLLFQLLRTFWVSRCQDICQGLCPINHHNPPIVWSIEHVVPKSVLRNPRVANDLHNLVYFPRQLNNARSSLKYVEANHSEDAKHVYPCKTCKLPGVECPLKGYMYKQRFAPPNTWKGRIARAVLYMAQQYPEYKSKINIRVLDLSVATAWNLKYPPGKDDYQWDEIVKTFQGNSNPYCHKTLLIKE